MVLDTDEIKIKLELIFRDIKLGFKNLIKWFPFVWNDRDWHYQSLFSFMEFKIRNMADSIEGTYIGSDEEANKMRECADIIKRIVEDDYDDFEDKERDLINAMKIIEKRAYAWWW